MHNKVRKATWLLYKEEQSRKCVQIQPKKILEVYKK